MSLEQAEQWLQQRDLSLAQAAFDAAEAAGEDPDRCSGGRWMVAMLQGDFEAAWQQSDGLRARRAPDPHRLWDGQSLHHKRVIVRCLHGLGDAVQMLRYAPQLRALARSVVWEVPPRLLDLAPCFDGVDQAVTWGDQAPPVPPPWESQIEVMELPYLFRTLRRSLPIAELYCHVPAPEVHRVSALMHGRNPNVGLVWTGGDWNPTRSLPFPLLAPLLNQPGITFWSLQARTDPETTASLRQATTLCGDGVLALAATIAHLDLVITIDTLAAHLAGALGKPVWLLLQHSADWRWLAAGDRSPWYPTMRLFRQRRAGDWTGVIEQVRAELEKACHITNSRHACF